MAKINKKYLSLLEEAKSKNTSGDRLKELSEPRHDNSSPFRIPPIKTPPYLLVDLPYCDRQAIRKAVICNLNTPLETLLRLGAYFPDELLNHPAIQPSSWEDLNFIEKLPWETLPALIQRKQVSKSLLKYAVKLGFSGITNLAQMQVSVSGEMTEGWHEAANKIIWKAPYEDDFTFNEHLERLYVSFELLPNFSEFVSSRVSNTSRFKNAMEKNFNNKSILKQLVPDIYSDSRCDIAGDSSTSGKVLESMACDRDYRIRRQVAGNPNTPMKILKTFTEDLAEEVRESVSVNIKCNLKMKETIFKNFAKSETPSFCRVALFLSDYAESAALANHSNSISWLERYAIACNQKTPEDTFKILAQDGNCIVRATAKESIEKRQ